MIMVTMIATMLIIITALFCNTVLRRCSFSACFSLAFSEVLREDNLSALRAISIIN